MCGVRNLLAVLAVALAMSGLAPMTSADTPNPEIADLRQSLEFVDTLATSAYVILNDETASVRERDGRFGSLLDRGFNVRYIALMALGPYAREFDEKGLADYQTKFRDFLFVKYATLVRASGAQGFHTLEAERADRRDVIVHVMVELARGSIDTEWRVRIFDGEPRIIDVRVAGFSLTEREREDFAVLIKQSGLDGLMSTLSAYSTNNRA